MQFEEKGIREGVYARIHAETAQRKKTQKDVDGPKWCDNLIEMKVETKNVAVPLETQKRLADYCKKVGVKIYHAAQLAIDEWLNKATKKPK